MKTPGLSTQIRACDACHRRKIQCDKSRPRCDWCKHHGLICTFDRPFRRRKVTRIADPARPIDSSQVPWAQSPDHATEARDAASGAGSTISGESSQHTTDGIHPRAFAEAASPSPCAGLGGFYFDGLHLGGISSRNGVPFFSQRGNEWIQARVGSAPVLRPHTAGLPSQGPRQSSYIPTRVEGTWELPPRSMVKAYFLVFFRSALRYVFPIVDDASFMGIVDRAYDFGLDAQSHDVMCAKACVLAFMGVLIHMEGRLETRQCVDDEQCVARAERLMPHILMGANAESLQVCSMLSMYHIYSGNTSAAGTFLSLACRFALMLGAHRAPPPAGPEARGDETPRRAQTHLRGLFWLCYMFDKDMCLRAGYPPVIDDDHCDLTLPEGYKQIDDFDTFKDGSDVFPGDMRLSIIKSSAIRQLYCARAFQKSDAELLRDIRELDDELEAWRMSIQPLNRPTLATMYRIHLEPAFNKPKKIHLIVIHLEYYFLLALLHSASGRCRAWTNRGGQSTSITSSQALALQASRSTIVNLAAVADVFDCGDFWYFVLYPIFASLTIFCNILLSPRNPEAEGDVRLLEQVPAIIRVLRAHRVDPGENARTEQVGEFILELMRLSRLAVGRAC